MGGGASSIGRSGSSKAAAAKLATWEGYWLPTQSKLEADESSSVSGDVLQRFIGAAPGRNKLMGGLLLHTTRKAFSGSCAGECSVAS
jgi:hypothetical protein